MKCLCKESYFCNIGTDKIMGLTCNQLHTQYIAFTIPLAIPRVSGVSVFIYFSKPKHKFHFVKKPLHDQLMVRLHGSVKIYYLFDMYICSSHRFHLTDLWCSVL